jgi:hypothetical protein
MASGLYGSGATKLITGVIDVDTDNLTPTLIDTGVYSINYATHDFYDDLSGVVEDGGTTYWAGASVSGGVLDFTDYTMPTVSGASIELVVTSEYNATPSARALLCAHEVTSTTPNGNDIDLIVDSGANKFLSLSLGS